MRDERSNRPNRGEATAGNNCVIIHFCMTHDWSLGVGSPAPTTAWNVCQERPEASLMYLSYIHPQQLQSIASPTPKKVCVSYIPHWSL